MCEHSKKAKRLTGLKTAHKQPLGGIKRVTENNWGDFAGAVPTCLLDREGRSQRPSSRHEAETGEGGKMGKPLCPEFVLRGKQKYWIIQIGKRIKTPRKHVVPEVCLAGDRCI